MTTIDSYLNDNPDVVFLKDLPEQSQWGALHRFYEITFATPLELSADKEYAVMAGRSANDGNTNPMIYQCDSAGNPINERVFTQQGHDGLGGDTFTATYVENGNKPYIVLNGEKT